MFVNFTFFVYIYFIYWSLCNGTICVDVLLLISRPSATSGYIFWQQHYDLVSLGTQWRVFCCTTNLVNSNNRIAESSKKLDGSQGFFDCLFTFWYDKPDLIFLVLFLGLPMQRRILSFPCIQQLDLWVIQNIVFELLVVLGCCFVLGVAFCFCCCLFDVGFGGVGWRGVSNIFIQDFLSEHPFDFAVRVGCTLLVIRAA